MLRTLTVADGWLQKRFADAVYVLQDNTRPKHNVFGKNEIQILESSNKTWFHTRDASI